MKNKSLSMVAAVLSVVAVVLAVLDSGGVGVWLAASTWLIVAIVLAVWAVYTKE